MEAKELRIGNLVYYKLKEIVVTTIGEYGIQSKSDETVINAKFSTPDLKPIQLTEEWLLKFGFVKKVDISGYYFIKDKHRVYLFQNGKFEFEFNYIDGKRVNLFKTFQYVHQLQNLYYALTGQELKLNDK